MPLRKGSSKEAISSNISKMVGEEGMDRNQAIAIALSQAKPTRKKKKKKKPTYE